MLKKKKNEEGKIDSLLSNIEEIKSQKIDLQRTITQLEGDVIACYKKAGTSNNETIRAEVTKGNSTWQAIGKKHKMISNLDDEISNLKKEVETLKESKKINVHTGLSRITMFRQSRLIFSDTH